MQVSRREFLKGAAAGAVGVAAMGVMCAANAENETQANIPASLSASEFEESEVVLTPITAWDEEYSYDIVIVGAGSAGVSAALTASALTDSVCVLQKISVANSQGGGPNGIIYDQSDERGILSFISAFQKDNQYRCDRDQFAAYLKHSYAAIAQAHEAAKEGAAISPEITFSYREGKTTYGGYDVATVAMSFSPKPISNTEGVQLLSTVAENRGVAFYYNTPAVQLIQEGDAVVGVFGQNAEGKCIRFNAAKAVILCTGDYQNNPAMVQKYCPDAYDFAKKQVLKTGDGHLMAIMAGAVMEPIGHTKMIHDTDSGPMRNEPFLIVSEDGLRCMDETIPYENKCDILRNQPKPGRCTQIFDSNYIEQCTQWGGNPSDIETLEKHIPGNVENPSGVYVHLIDTHKADTLEELAEIIGIPADALAKSVEDYNALCDKGIDSAFGKDPKYMMRIEQPPFYGIHKNYRVSALCSGVLVNAGCQVLGENKQIIPGLYACGNTAGQFYGGSDYPFTMAGISIGRAYTQGYIAAKHALGAL